MKRVMIVSNSLSGGGAERSMNLLCNELTKRGWNVALVPINEGDTDLVVPNCEIFHLHRQWRSGPLDTLLAIYRFNKIVSLWRPDKIILNCELPELFGALLLSHESLVIVEHSSIAWMNRAILGKVVRRILTLRGGIWVAVSSHLKIWPTNKSPAVVIQNPLASESLVENKTAPTEILKRILFVGRLSPEKRPDFLLEIGEDIGVPIVMMGDGVEKETLQSEIDRRGLDITLCGQILDPWSLVKAGDLLIAPSASEGDGLVVVEGMQIGIPMILSDIPSFQRFGLPNGNYCGSAKDFIDRIEEYRNNLSFLVVPKEISKPILSLRSTKTVGDSWENLLETHS